MNNDVFINQIAEIQGMRKYLGLELKEIAELFDYNVRSVQYWEAGKQVAPQKIIQLMDRLCTYVDKVVENEISVSGKKNYVSLPYFMNYEDFYNSSISPMPTKSHWKVWQRIVTILKVKKITKSLTVTGDITKDMTNLVFCFNSVIMDRV